MSLFGKNIKKIRTVKSMSQQAFAEIFELKRGTLGAYEEERSEPRIETIMKIANHFSISIDHLLTKELTVNQLLKFDQAFEEDENAKRKEFIDIPCISPSDHHEYIKYASNPQFINNLCCIKLPLHNHHELRAFVVDNLEMSSNNGGLFPKDVVIGEKVQKAQFKTIENAEMSLVLTSKELLLKRIYSEKNIFILKADHAEIEPVELNYSEIKELWKIKYVFHHRISNISQTKVQDKLKYLEDEFLKLKSSL